MDARRDIDESRATGAVEGTNAERAPSLLYEDVVRDFCGVEQACTRYAMSTMFDINIRE